MKGFVPGRDPRLHDRQPWPTERTAALFRFSTVLGRRAVQLEREGRSAGLVRRVAFHAWTRGCRQYELELIARGDRDTIREMAAA